MTFYQVNHDGAEQLYRIAGEFAALQPEDILLDLYCGAGTIGLSLAHQVKEVIGVEIVPNAVKNAAENARKNGIENARFFCGDAAAAAEQLAHEGNPPDGDPHRSAPQGLQPRTAGHYSRYGSGPAGICFLQQRHPGPGRRSAPAKGLSDPAASAVDMFPRTAHVETVVLLGRELGRSREHVYLDYEPSKEIDLPGGATYEQIKAYVLEHTGLKVSHLYIAQVKQKHGIIERECYNKPKSEDAKQPQCPPEKEAAIEAALKHFKMI